MIGALHTLLRKALGGRLSLLRGLWVRMTIVTALVVALAGYFAYSAAKHQIDRMFDAQLMMGANLFMNFNSGDLIDKNKAVALHGAMDFKDDSLPGEEREAFEGIADSRMYRIWVDHQLYSGTDTGPKLIPPGHPQSSTFREVKEGDDSWRIYTLTSPDRRVVVEVGELLDVRELLIGNIAVKLAAPLVLIAPISLILIWFALRNGLAALDSLRFSLAKRDATDFSPVVMDRLPDELEVLVATINGLLARIEQSFVHERQFVDHAAHQLRTPLAALRIQAQLCMRVKDEAERRSGLKSLIEAVDRASELIDQLLTLARMETDAGPTSWGAFTLLGDAVGSVFADLAPLAATQEVELAFDGGDERIACSPASLDLILSNLVGNALRHSPRGGEVEVRVISPPGTPTLTLEVIDNGPGVSLEHRETAFERFWRGPRESGAGSGLGLAIARESARRLGGDIELSGRPDGAPGLVARVRLPAKL